MVSKLSAAALAIMLIAAAIGLTTTRAQLAFAEAPDLVEKAEVTDQIIFSAVNGTSTVNGTNNSTDGRGNSNNSTKGFEWPKEIFSNKVITATKTTPDCDTTCMQALVDKVITFFVKGNNVVIENFPESPYWGMVWSEPKYNDRTYETAFDIVADDLYGYKMNQFKTQDSLKKATVLFVLADEKLVSPSQSQDENFNLPEDVSYDDLTTFELYEILGDENMNDEDWEDWQ